MTTPTSNPVPSTSPLDLLFNTERLDIAVTSSLSSYTDRLGVNRLTLAGAINTIREVTMRGAWATATVYSAKDIVSSGGGWYIALDAHTSGASFAADEAAHWRLHQGVPATDLNNVIAEGADPTGAADSAPAFAAAGLPGKLVWRPKGTYKRGAVTRVHPTDGFEGILWIGNGIVNNSDDPQVVVSRDVDDSGSGNAHSFTDNSVYTRGGGISHNCFDDRTKVVAAGPSAHHASFQVGTEYAISGGGTFGNHFGYINSVTVTAGTLTNHFGAILNPPAISGSGAVVNCWGLYAPLGYGKGGPGFNQASGVVNFLTNESHAMCYSLGPVQGQDGLIAGNGAGASYVNAKTIDAVTNAGTAVGVRFQQVGTQQLDLEIPANQTYATLSNAAGEVFRITSTKAMIFQPATTAPALTINGQLVLTPTSDTNLRISYRGSDGVTRVANITLA